MWEPGPALYLRTRDEGDANGELALHAPAQELGPRVPLVLQTEDAQHLLYFLMTAPRRQAFQLKGKKRGTVKQATLVAAELSNQDFDCIHINHGQEKYTLSIPFRERDRGRHEYVSE